MSKKDKFDIFTKCIPLIILFVLWVLYTVIRLDGMGIFDLGVNRTHFRYNGEVIKYITPKLPIILCVLCEVLVIVLVIISIVEQIRVREGGVLWNVLRFLGKLIAVGVSIFLLLIFSINCEHRNHLSKGYSPEFYEFSNGVRTIVICESSWLLGGWAEVYQIYEDGTAWCIGKLSTDDGYRNEGDYEVVWQEDGVTLIHKADSYRDNLYECYCAWVDE